MQKQANYKDKWFTENISYVTMSFPYALNELAGKRESNVGGEAKYVA